MGLRGNEEMGGEDNAQLQGCHRVRLGAREYILDKSSAEKRPKHVAYKEIIVIMKRFLNRFKS